MNPFTKRRTESVAAWGEEKLIAAIRGWLSNASPSAPFGIGDDCAVLAPSRRLQLLTVDPVIYGRHFDDTVSPRAVGEKLLKRNLSDLAAMGGRPVAAVIALTLDPRIRRDWLAKFHRSLAAVARQYHVKIVGGDVAQADGILAASLTLLGEAAGSRVLTRTGARVGDAIYVTGTLGRSRATGHHYRFVPRLAEGAWLASRSYVRAMIDVSDGLAKDLRALAPRKATPALFAEKLPLREGADLHAALTEGEDYELLFILASTANERIFEAAWRKRFPNTPLSRIGTFVAKGASVAGTLDLGAYHGYEHLR